MLKYPRQCVLCNRSYKSQQTFSSHRKRCHEFVAQKEVSKRQVEAAIARRSSTIDVEVSVKNLPRKDEREDANIIALKNQVDILTRELEIVKLQQDKGDRKVPLTFATGHSIYLAQTRDCFDKDNNVFKIGRTADVLKRQRGYPKGTIFIYNRLCVNAQEMESRILTKAAALYKRRTDYGNEYFEAELNALIDLIHDEMNLESKKKVEVDVIKETQEVKEVNI